MQQAATPVAHVDWNEAAQRFELHILGTLKAYSEGDEPTREAHEDGRAELVRMAKKAGYFTKEGARNGDATKD